jgi:hypothetical protein
MRRVLPVLLLVVLVAAFTIGCSRQPQPHFGEWDGKMKVEWRSRGVISRVIEIDSVFFFSKDGKVQKIGTDFFTEKEKVEEGEYKIDYSQKPIQLEINWYIEGKNYKSPGIVRFIGEDKNRMQYCFSFPDELPVSSFDDALRCWWLTKKVKK